MFGDPARDFPRLRRLVPLLERETSGQWHVTLDGNENFHDVAAFRDYWDQARAEPALHGLWPHVLVVEQPVHRDHALGDDMAAMLRDWPGRPPLIIDESDGAVGDVPRALSLGRAPPKNARASGRGVANAARLLSSGTRSTDGPDREISAPSARWTAAGLAMMALRHHPSRANGHTLPRPQHLRQLAGARWTHMAISIAPMRTALPAAHRRGARSRVGHAAPFGVAPRWTAISLR